MQMGRTFRPNPFTEEGAYSSPAVPLMLGNQRSSVLRVTRAGLIAQCVGVDQVPPSGELEKDAGAWEFQV
jgi:hypothetical protein